MTLAFATFAGPSDASDATPRASAPTASAGKVLMPKRVKMILEFRNRAIA
ncbi:MAG: hypothetical protein AAGD00_08640 [Planctomycetota bacterium]